MEVRDEAVFQSIILSESIAEDWLTNKYLNPIMKLHGWKEKLSMWTKSKIIFYFGIIFTGVEFFPLVQRKIGWNVDHIAAKQNEVLMNRRWMRQNRTVYFVSRS